MIDFGLSLWRRRRGSILGGSDLATELVSPTTTWHLFLIGDSRRQQDQIYVLQYTAEVAWTGCHALGDSTLDTAGQTVLTATDPWIGDVTPPTSPYVGGGTSGVTWFAHMSAEARFTGDAEAVPWNLSRLTYSILDAATFPLLYAGLTGKTAVARSIVYKHASGMSGTPGIRLIFDSGDANTVFGDYILDVTGSGYLPVSLSVPGHDWETEDTINLTWGASPGAATVAGETWAAECPWLEAEGNGVVYHNLAVSGSSIRRWLNENIHPSSLWSDLYPLYGDNRILWIDSGANATAEEYTADMRELIRRFRVGSPGGSVIVSTQFAHSTSGANPFWQTTSRLIASDTPGVLLLDTYEFMPPFSVADAWGWMSDIVHQTPAGKTALSRLFGDMIAATANGTLDVVTLGSVDAVTYVGVSVSVSVAAIGYWTLTVNGISADDGFGDGTAQTATIVPTAAMRAARTGDTDAVVLTAHGVTDTGSTTIWSPAEIVTLAGWWDVDDASTLTGAPAAVTLVADKVNSFDLAVVGTVPYDADGLSGRGCMVLASAAGTNHLRNQDAGLVPKHVFVVARWDDTPGTAAGLASGGVPSWGWFWKFAAANSSLYLQGLYGDRLQWADGAVVDLGLGYATDDEAHVHEAVTGASEISGICVMAERAQADLNWVGAVGEVLAFSAQLSVPDQAAVRAYLKAKWGTP